MSGETSTGAQSSIDNWVPTSRFRPDSFTTDVSVAFVSSATHLIACLLHTPSSTVDLKPLHDFIDSIDIVALDVFDQVAPSLKSSFDLLNDWSSDDIVSGNAIYLCLYYADGPSQDVPEATIHTAAAFVYDRMYDFKHNATYDEELTTLMETVGSVQFDTVDDALPYLQHLEQLWVDYSQNPWFCSGRGSEFYANLHDIQRSYVTVDSSWNMACSLLIGNFVVYDLGTNFLFTALATAARVAFPVAKYVTGVASRMLFSNTGNLLASKVGKMFTEENKKQVEGDIAKDDVDPAFLNNLRNSVLSKAIENLKPAVEKHSASFPGCLASFYLNKKTDPNGEHNPIVGRSNCVDTTNEDWRKPVDDMAMWVLDRGIDMFTRRTSEKTINNINTFLEAIHDLRQEMAKKDTEFLGRGPAETPEEGVNAEEHMYFGEYMRRNRSRLVEASKNVTDLNTPEARATTILAMEVGGDAGAIVPVDSRGDLPDMRDLRMAQRRFDDAETQNRQLQEALANERAQRTQAEQDRDQLQRLIDRGRITSGTMSHSARYVNWDVSQSKELIAAINSKWMDLKDAFELIDTLNACNFKYDTSRDSVREALTGDQFLIGFPVKYNRRFPDDVAMVCQNHTDVQRAITDILAALNYKNDENVRGPNTSDKPKVRETTAYNDAALNYVNAVSTLASIFKRVALNQSKFERRFGLTWLSP